MIRGLTIALVTVALVSLATCQTFQYSRGWTNGKRAETSPLASILDYRAAMAGAGGRMNDLQMARCANLLKWKMFLLSSGDNEEVCRVPCEFLDVLRQCLIRQDKASPNDLSDFRRPSAPALETSSSLSY
ncbi:pro-corazonin [Nasonia vitripennis]|uniref:Pro-corazonin n=1 Tax=Nasonia vitripennis TaxID=7425 RepID=A0A7M7QB09_NASVI|nr:pro-corazonin [Nasonia vitripennis]XP_031784774.1 pro-corazonin [Nasonia vitripennis]